MNALGVDSVFVTATLQQGMMGAEGVHRAAWFGFMVALFYGTNPFP
jgi:hypothetical protein